MVAGATRERGQSLPVLVLLLAVTMATVTVVARLGVRGVTLARDQNTADAVALAVADDASLEVVAGLSVDASTDVRRHGQTVVAITGAPTRWAAATRTTARAGLAPAMIAAVATTEAALGRPIPIVSGHRSPVEQQALWDRRHTNPLPVAPPGTSKHERGLAIDVAEWFVPILALHGPRTGLCRPLPQVDPVHFELCRRMPNP